MICPWSRHTLRSAWQCASHGEPSCCRRHCCWRAAGCGAPAPQPLASAASRHRSVTDSSPPQSACRQRRGVWAQKRAQACWGGCGGAAAAAAACCQSSAAGAGPPTASRSRLACRLYVDSDQCGLWEEWEAWSSPSAAAIDNIRPAGGAAAAAASGSSDSQRRLSRRPTHLPVFIAVRAGGAANRSIGVRLHAGSRLQANRAPK